MTKTTGKQLAFLSTAIVVITAAAALTGCDGGPCRDAAGNVVTCDTPSPDGGMMNPDAGDPPDCFDPMTGEPTGECDEDAGVDPDSGVDPDAGTPTTVTVTAVINDGRRIVITGTSTPMDCSKPVVVGPNSVTAIPGTAVTISADGLTATATGVPRNTGASIRLCHSMADGSGLDIAHTASVAGTACVLTSTAAGWNLFKSITASAGTVGVTDPTHTGAACRMQVR